jgi:hypothetical protein
MNLKPDFQIETRSDYTFVRGSFGHAHVCLNNATGGVSVTRAGLLQDVDSLPGETWQQTAARALRGTFCPWIEETVDRVDTTVWAITPEGLATIHAMRHEYADGERRFSVWVRVGDAKPVMLSTGSLNTSAAFCGAAHVACADAYKARTGQSFDAPELWEAIEKRCIIAAKFLGSC